MLFVGIDIGGTFTDFALYDSATDDVAVHKVRSTPSDPAKALADGFVELCALAGVRPERVAGVLHGTTVATNAVLEHRGAMCGLVTTAGMRDVVHIGRHQRPQAYSVMQDIPWQSRPFVLREHRILVRWFDDPSIRGYLRITVGTPTEAEALLEAAKAILP